MNSPTSAYKSLNVSLQGLKPLLSRVPDTSCDTNLQHLKVQSYLFLSHAAFEQYLEEIATITMRESVADYNKSDQINSCVMSLIAFETVAQFDDMTPRKKIRADVVKNLQNFVNIASRNHETTIKGNNGIKLKDQNALFLPVGLDPLEVDIVTANGLDSFGGKRGSVAHKLKIQTTETKSSVLSESQTLFKGLKNFDEEVCRIINTKTITKA